jgi:catechol O-methyltransferase
MTRDGSSTNNDDPFAVFDDSEDDETNDDRGATKERVTEGTATRDPECGVLAFHSGTEQALLHFVRNALPPGNEVSRKRMLSLVDEFCFSRHWMMHVGPEKGATLEGFLGECLNTVMKQGGETDVSSRPFVLVELGTYCGYSSILIADAILEWFRRENRAPDFHIFTVDVSQENVNVAKELISLGGLEEYVTFTVLQEPDKVEKELSTSLLQKMKERYPDRSPIIDFLFVDHDKNAYLPDVLQLEEQKLIRSGTHVAADNVVFFQLGGYRQHMETLANQGVVTTRLVTGCLEYVDGCTRHAEVGDTDVQDGVGKFFVVLRLWTLLCVAVNISEFTSFLLFVELTIYREDPPN